MVLLQTNFVHETKMAGIIRNFLTSNAKAFCNLDQTFSPNIHGMHLKDWRHFDQAIVGFTKYKVHYSLINLARVPADQNVHEGMHRFHGKYFLYYMYLQPMETKFGDISPSFQG